MARSHTWVWPLEGTKKFTNKGFVPWPQIPFNLVCLYNFTHLCELLLLGRACRRSCRLQVLGLATQQLLLGEDLPRRHAAAVPSSPSRRAACQLKTSRAPTEESTPVRKATPSPCKQLYARTPIPTVARPSVPTYPPLSVVRHDTRQPKSKWPVASGCQGFNSIWQKMT